MYFMKGIFYDLYLLINSIEKKNNNDNYLRSYGSNFIYKSLKIIKFKNITKNKFKFIFS